MQKGGPSSSATSLDTGAQRVFSAAKLLLLKLPIPAYSAIKPRRQRSVSNASQFSYKKLDKATNAHREPVCTYGTAQITLVITTATVVTMVVMVIMVILDMLIMIVIAVMMAILLTVVIMVTVVII